MSKHHEYLQNLQKVSDLIIDPHVERSQNQIRHVNNLSRNGMLEREDVKSAAEELDKVWPHKGEAVLVSGKVHGQEGGYGDEYVVSVKDRTAISYGFDINTVNGISVVGHHLGILEQNIGQQERDDGVGRSFSAWADPSEIFVSPLEMDAEKAAKLFEYHYPSAFRDIEAQLVNSSEGYGTRGEIDVAAIESLSEVVITHDADKGDAQEDRNMISKYLEHMVPLNHTNVIPYSIALKGLYYTVNSETGDIDISTAKIFDRWNIFLALPQKILLIPHLSVDENLSAVADYNKSIVAVYFYISDIEGVEPNIIQPVVVPISNDIIMDPNAQYQRFSFLE